MRCLPLSLTIKCKTQVCVCVFQLYDSDGDGFLSADDLSGLMAALVGVPQYSIAEMYTELTKSGEPSEGQ